MATDFTQHHWNAELAEQAQQVIRAAKEEDLDETGDLTARALVPEGRKGRAAIVSRAKLVVAGLAAGQNVLAEYDGNANINTQASDGDQMEAGAVLAEIEGDVRTLLAAERVLLNIIGRLSGIATLTRRFVDAVSETKARIYDTRKTTPGWRTLEKYAVGCGGGMNHRTGLYDAVLIKDNHLAFGAGEEGGSRFTPAEAVIKVREFYGDTPNFRDLIIEVEVDTLAQLADVLTAQPDIVLLDNMPPEVLTKAVALRDEMSPHVELEASGGVTIDTVAAIAQTGVERISVGGLTHSSRCADVGLDWLD